MSHVDTNAVWLGHPGHLIKLPDPSPGVETIRTRDVAIHVGVSGGRSVDVTGSGLRTFTYAYSRMTEHEASLIDAFHAGDHGCGPFALIDPVYPNRLDAAQASGGATCGHARGFTVDHPDRLDVDTCHTHHGAASLLWTFNPQHVRHLALPSRWPALPDGVRAFPIIPNAPVNLTAYVRPETTTWAGWAPHFYNAQGHRLTTPACDPAVAAADTWSPITAAGVCPPRGAAWIAPRLAATTVEARICDPARMHVDSLSMTYGQHILTEQPRPGAGVPQVDITAWSQTIPHLGHIDGGLELTEVCGEADNR